MKAITLKLTTEGRCCGKKPLRYKRKKMLFCSRCCAQFSEDGQHQANFAWKASGNGFIPVHTIYPTGQPSPEYVKWQAVEAGI